MTLQTNYDFIQNMIGLQGIAIIYRDVNNDIFQIFATFSHSFTVCPRCGREPVIFMTEGWRP